MFFFYLPPDDKTLQKYSLAQNPNTPPETLEFLATDEDRNVRRYVAQNPNTPQEILKLLATDEYSYVRYWVARNPNRTELIERLVFMVDMVYENKQTPIESLDTFEFYVFLNVASVEELEGNYLKPETLSQIFTAK
jgi:hypothetical protein